jgi:hypothetical protein
MNAFWCNLLAYVYTVHCPKTHEQFPSSFGNAEVISSDRRKLFINICFQNYLETVHEFARYIKEILCKSLQCTSVGANLQPLDYEANAIQLYHLFSMTIVQKNIKFLRKWQWDISRILYINLWNFSWIFYELFPKLPGKIGPVNISKTTMNCFQNYLENLTSSIFPSSFGNFSK